MSTQQAMKDDHGKSQAAAQLESIKEMVEALKKADKDYDTLGDDAALEAARQAIQDDPLSIEVRNNWYSPGGPDRGSPEEYRILLCTGGPAVRIVAHRKNTVSFYAREARRCNLSAHLTRTDNPIRLICNIKTGLHRGPTTRLRVKIAPLCYSMLNNSAMWSSEP